MSNDASTSKAPLYLLGGLTVMLFAVSGFLAYYLMQRQESLAVGGVEDKGTRFTEMVSQASAAGLEYEDKVYLDELFATLKEDSDLQYVEVRNGAGEVFAAYPEAAADVLAAPDEAKRTDTSVSGTSVSISRQVLNGDGENLGSAHMGFSLTRVNTEVAYGTKVIAVIVTLTTIACFIAFFIAMRFEKARTKAFERLEAASEAVQRRNNDMRLVMDNVDQGFITVDEHAHMSDEHSAVVEKWFGRFKPGARLWDYVGAQDPNFGVGAEMQWGELEDRVFPIWCHIEQLPKRIDTARGTYSVAYSMLGSEEDFAGVLVVITDITESLAAEAAQQQQREVVHLLESLMEDRNGFLSFHREASQTIERLAENPEDIDPTVLKREIHTLKGNSSLYNLDSVAKLCHEVEEQMAQNESLSVMFDDLKSRWNDLSDTLTKLTGDREQNVIAVDPDAHETLIKKLAALGQKDLVEQVAEWRLEPVQKPLERLAIKAQDLSRRLGKGELEIEISADGTRLDPDEWGQFWSEMAHVVRNAVDHGLQTPDERERSGKAGPATLKLSARRVGKQLKVMVTDNGRGIDWNRVRDKAANLGMATEGKDALVSALLADNFTTRDEATEHSGRGVGMAAVAAAAGKLGGSVDVESQPGKGTTWVFSLPYTVHVPSFARSQAIHTVQQPPHS